MRCSRVRLDNLLAKLDVSGLIHDNSFTHKVLRQARQRRPFTSIPTLTTQDVQYFRESAFIPELPAILRGSHILPATTKWFMHQDGPFPGLSSHLTEHTSIVLPYELVRDLGSTEYDSYTRFVQWLQTEGDKNLPLYMTRQISSEREIPPAQETVFDRFHAPLDLLARAIKYNSLQPRDNRFKRLYIAQAQLTDLPGSLQQDLPVPEVVRCAGKGDVYDSSIWLGLEPTYTPLHRDPNPNLFVQLLSAKTIRLLSPELGQQLYARVQNTLGSRGNSRFRGAEMMQGQERAALFDAVWRTEPSKNIHEARIEAGDALFIPKGWWHSVKSNFEDGRLNASVNWWFR